MCVSVCVYLCVCVCVFAGIHACLFCIHLKITIPCIQFDTHEEKCDRRGLREGVGVKRVCATEQGEGVAYVERRSFVQGTYKKILAE